MRYNNLDLNLLVALDALFSECNVTNAAFKINLSQSAMSSALARSREYFKDDLLIRLNGKMQLTPRGLELKNHISDVLLKIDSAITAHSSFDAPSSKRNFRIFASDYATHIIIPEFLKLTYQQSKFITFEFIEYGRNLVSSLERGELDLAILPKGRASDNHCSEQLMTEDFICIACINSQHDAEKFTLKDYLNHGHVAMQPPVMNPIEENFLNKLGVQRRIEVKTYSFSSVARLLTGTSRIGTIQTRLAQNLVEKFPIKLLPFPVGNSKFQLILQWHNYKRHDLGLLWVRQMMHRARIAIGAN